MTALASLPTLAVSIAFNPTNLQSLTQTWTDVTTYVRDFTTSSGRQHFLDRIESSTIRLTLDNRTGYFLNGTTNGTGSVIRTRLPIRVLAGWPAVNVTAISGSGTVVTYTAANTYTAGQQIIVQNATTAAFNGVFTVATATATQFTVASTATGTTSTATVAAAYPVFWGLTESAEERTADQLNQDILLTATDNTKYLSLLYMSKPTFYRQYVNAVVTTSTSSVTIATGSKTFTVPALAAVPATGTAVSITATAVQGQAPIIAVGTVSAGTTSTSLVVNITNTFISGITAGPYTSWAIAIGSDMGYYSLNATGINDQILGNALTINGIVDVTSPGALLYSPDTATDLSNNNATNNVASITLPQGVGYSTTIGSVDFWILGQTLAGQSIMVWEDSSASSVHSLSVASTGELIDYNFNTRGTTHSNVRIVDGQWHHIGLYATSAGTISLYCDGVFTTIGSTTGQIIGQGYGLFIGNSVSAGNNYPAPAFPLTGLVSQLTIGAPYAQTSQSNIINRWTAGSLLNRVISSGDRIAEVLTLAGYGSIVSGALVVPNYTVNDVTWTANSGAFFVQNLQSPVTSSTALDLIQQVTDTDVGAFFQKPDGSFEFDDQAYLYTATNNATPTGANVWSDTAGGSVTTFYEPSTLQVLRDDADLWTTVKITAQNGTVQTYENTSAEPLYAYSTLTKSNVVSVTNEQAMQEAIYLGNLYQSPLPRVGNVELRSQTNNGANLVEMLSPYLNDQVRFIRSANGASAAGSINSAVVIESIRHDFQADPGYWHTSFTLDPFPKRGQNSTPQTFFLLFDDSTYGTFDTTNEYL